MLEAERGPVQSPALPVDTVEPGARAFRRRRRALSLLSTKENVVIRRSRGRARLPRRDRDAAAFPIH